MEKKNSYTCTTTSIANRRPRGGQGRGWLFVRELGEQAGILSGQCEITAVVICRTLVDFHTRNAFATQHGVDVSWTQEVGFPAGGVPAYAQDKVARAYTHGYFLGVQTSERCWPCRKARKRAVMSGHLVTGRRMFFGSGFPSPDSRQPTWRRRWNTAARRWACQSSSCCPAGSRRTTAPPSTASCRRG